MKTYLSVSEYIEAFPEPVQIKLNALRDLIKEIAPQATEVIAYGMPAYKLNGPLIYFAAYKQHIGFYPTPSGIEAFQEELNGYKKAKGSVQFPIERSLPLTLISNIIRFRVMENSAKKSKG
jgi:uncharacterized protein YdhG (YjbR/CyaY superfamily)